uniref:PD-(D/E)XK nuclease superfamily protein n=1 Tax=Candidatus Kentrum sp. TUN TaxID=2126343 RepID=A0A450ZL82_9GAMM|nr:MAG: PD-(D/E)XK nuclease superfamily protein [Candidatus Kentron sp. TUN]VFK57126.1 MAG: PD-(D/E)XK nuclease superfamily protein [Candidatus Kentron sp. TUN]VFK57910.1 MAG: PD-(D/E)XK nuclease superfamily protein [Candidatus Kentron sp. TUN]
MEFKRLGENESIEEQLRAAPAQIEEKQHSATLHAHGHGEILALAIVFDGKRLTVRARLSGTVGAKLRQLSFHSLPGFRDNLPDFQIEKIIHVCPFEHDGGIGPLMGTPYRNDFSIRGQ